MIKKPVIVPVLFALLLLVGSLFVIAQNAEDAKVVQESSAECSFWCKVKQVLFGREEAVAGKVTQSGNVEYSVNNNQITVDCSKYPSQCQRVMDHQAAEKGLKEAHVTTTCSSGNFQCELTARANYDIDNMREIAQRGNTLIDEVRGYIAGNPRGEPAPIPAAPAAASPPPAPAPAAPAAAQPPPKENDAFIRINPATGEELGYVIFDGRDWILYDSLFSPVDSGQAQEDFNTEQNNNWNHFWAGWGVGEIKNDEVIQDVVVRKGESLYKYSGQGPVTVERKTEGQVIIYAPIIAPSGSPAAPSPSAGGQAISAENQIRQVYGNLLPRGQLNPSTDIKLTDGRTIQYKEQDGAVVVTETIPGAGELSTTRERLIYRNEDLGYGWKSENNRYTRDDVSLEFRENSMIRTEGDEQTTTTYLQAARAGRTIDVREVEIKEDGKLVSREYLNPQGDRFAFADVENGRETRIRIYDTNGHLERICPAGKPDCVRNPENTENIYVGNDWACRGGASTCREDNNKISEDDACKNSANNDLCGAIGLKERDSFFNYEGGFWDFAHSSTEWQQSIGRFTRFIDARPGWEGLSHWLTPDAQNRLQRWGRENFDFAFRFDMDLVVPQWLCDYDAVHRVERDGESTIMLEVSPGVVQTSASISAERSPQPGPILCSEELPCRTDEECSEDGFCEKDGERLEDGYFYRISWAVTAPTDESFTPYLDENGVAIKFNVRIEGDRNMFLYEVGGLGNEFTLQLANGQSDRDTIIGYSPRSYSRVCLIFGEGPKDLAGNVVREACATIAESALGQVQWERGGRPGSSGGGNAIVRSSDAQRVQI